MQTVEKPPPKEYNYTVRFAAEHHVLRLKTALWKLKNSSHKAREVNGAKAAIIRVTAGFLDGDGEKFTVDDIAAALKISKKTIYKYFDGKEQPAKAVFDDIIAKAESAQKDLRAKASDARRMLIDYLILFLEIYRLNRDAVFRMYGLSESLKKHALRAAEKNRDGFISLYEEYAPSAKTDADTLKTVICGTLKEIYNRKNRAEKAEKCLAFVLR